jgi:oligosaccharyltransferase complex subunit beta
MRLILALLNFLAIVNVLMASSSSSSGLEVDGQGKRVLALLDNYGIRETHSTFFKSLKDRGFQVTYKVADDADLALTKYSEYIYDHLVLFCPNVVEFGGNVSSKSVIDFIDAGGNVLIAASSQLTDPLKEVAGECGVEFSDEGSYVIDRFNSDVNDDGQNTLIVSDTGNLLNNKVIAGNAKTGAPFLYRGVGMTVDPENPLLIEILTGSVTAYTYKPDEAITDYPHSIGKNTLLISALQARNNARVVFVGSLDFFSNEFFESSVQKSIGKDTKKFDKSGNEELSTSLAQWAFKEKGVLRVTSVKHHRLGETNPPAAYTIKENLVYAINIEEMVSGKWQPFQGVDVQFEFVRLDPFVRSTLAKKNGNYEIQFQIPDVYGVFKCVVDYNRVGYTHLFSSTQVSVRPLQHTEYDRFIPTAYPYYASAFSMIITVFFFTFIQLYHSDAPAPKTVAAQK